MSLARKLVRDRIRLFVAFFFFTLSYDSASAFAFKDGVRKLTNTIDTISEFLSPSHNLTEPPHAGTSQSCPDCEKGIKTVQASKTPYHTCNYSHHDVSPEPLQSSEGSPSTPNPSFTGNANVEVGEFLHVLAFRYPATLRQLDAVYAYHLCKRSKVIPCSKDSQDNSPAIMVYQYLEPLIYFNSSAVVSKVILTIQNNPIILAYWIVLVCILSVVFIVRSIDKGSPSILLRTRMGITKGYGDQLNDLHEPINHSDVQILSDNTQSKLSQTKVSTMAVSGNHRFNSKEPINRSDLHRGFNEFLTKSIERAFIKRRQASAVRFKMRSSNVNDATIRTSLTSLDRQIQHCVNMLTPEAKNPELDAVKLRSYLSILSQLGMRRENEQSGNISKAQDTNVHRVSAIQERGTDQTSDNQTPTTVRRRLPIHRSSELCQTLEEDLIRSTAGRTPATFRYRNEDSSIDSSLSMTLRSGKKTPVRPNKGKEETQ